MNSTKKYKSRIYLGMIVMISGFLSPVFIPLVLKSGLTDAIKSVITGLLVFGVPELFMLLAVVIMGKKGYDHIKQFALKYFKKIVPPDTVSPRRHKIGLVFFSLPLIIGFLQPYLAFFFSFSPKAELWLYIVLDFTFIVSLFILGGNFWDKLSGLFNRNIEADNTIN